MPGSVLLDGGRQQQRPRRARPTIGVFFDNNGCFARPRRGAERRAALAWFDSTAPLRSGWAWGQGYLNGGVAGIDATVGKGISRVDAEITFRAQPARSSSFNAIYLGRRGVASLPRFRAVA